MTPDPNSSRPRFRPVGVLVAAVVLAVGSQVTTIVGAGPTAGDPTSNEAGATGVARASLAPGPEVALAPPGVEPVALGPTELATIDRSIGTWTASLARSEHDFIAATSLAALYHARGRLTGDVTDLVRAETAADRALAGAPLYAPARLLQATIRFSLHDFAGALAAADDLLRDQPASADALAVAADALLELGRVAEAAERYARLAAVAEGPALEIRLARLALVEGRTGDAVAGSQAALDAARAAPADHDLAFYAFAAGEIARQAGDAAAARSGFEAALAIRPTDPAALLGLARVEAHDGALESATAHLELAVATIPQPEAVGLLSDLRAALGDDVGAATAEATLDAIRRLSAGAGGVFDRALLRFDLDHGRADEALLAAARRDLAFRPDAAGHDLVAWALHRLGRSDQAALEAELALAVGSRDARVLFHAGAIDLAIGETGRGRERLEAALALGPALDPLEREEAGWRLAESRREGGG
jgi:tetratricopeptide (TPR) repeat protein